MSKIRLFGTALFLFALIAGAARIGHADTVYLRNGNFIDGMVLRKTESGGIVLQVGTRGKLEIEKDVILRIEKNARRGSDAATRVAGIKPDAENQAAKEKRRKDAFRRRLERGKKFRRDRDPDEDADGDGSREDVGEESGDPELDEDDGDDEGASEGDDVERVDPQEDEKRESEDDVEDDEGDGEEERPEEEKEIDPELKKKIEGLVTQVQRQRSRDRVRAERHLKAIGAPAVPFLLPIADHKSPLVRVVVFRHFHRFGDDSVVESCIKALDDKNEFVRDYAHRALESITGEDFGFRPMARSSSRQRSQEKWQQWWQNEVEELEKLKKKSRRR